MNVLGLSRPVCAPGTLRVFAALLSYPDDDVRRHLSEMPEILRRENVLPAARLAELDALIAQLRGNDPLDAEAEYVQLFDRGRGTSLHLFEHVHGDSRDRGPAMIDLAQTYEKAGLLLAPGELPDYLPAVLEFVSTQPPREAKAFLGEGAHPHTRSSAPPETQRVCERAAALPSSRARRRVAPDVEEPLDEAWAEPLVFDGCSSKGRHVRGTATDPGSGWRQPAAGGTPPRRQPADVGIQP
jgi:nitrate reductase delta subunit